MSDFSLVNPVCKKLKCSPLTSEEVSKLEDQICLDLSSSLLGLNYLITHYPHEDSKREILLRLKEHLEKGSKFWPITSRIPRIKTI